MNHKEEVLFTVLEFAHLVHRTPELLTQLLRDGKLKGVQRVRHGCWLIPESELRKYWGNLYGPKPRDSEKDGAE